MQEHGIYPVAPPGFDLFFVEDAIRSVTEDKDGKIKVNSFGRLPYNTIFSFRKQYAEEYYEMIQNYCFRFSI